MPIKIIVSEDEESLEKELKKWAINVKKSIKFYSTSICSHNGKLVFVIIFSI